MTKTFSSEFAYNYKTYTFGYANYCVKEPHDKIYDLYARGYLPYSGSPGIKNTFYMARSARVILKTFEFSSENRRIVKKFDETLSSESIAIKNFKIHDNHFLNFCSEYFTKRHGPDIMPRERLLTILNSGFITNIVCYRKNNEPIAYVFEVSDKSMVHFWFSFYNLNYSHQSLGMWLMLDQARLAKKAGIEYFYVGTVYGDRALYKTSFENLEYWDGADWQNNTKQLKHLARSDNKRIIGLVDTWKTKIGKF